eukprot:11534542-Alexandrium_andersonii.AAC.1
MARGPELRSRFGRNREVRGDARDRVFLRSALATCCACILTFNARFCVPSSQLVLLLAVWQFLYRAVVGFAMH